MENLNLHKSDYSVYPGEYVPLLKEEEMQEELKQWDKDQIVPQVNITELADSFDVEVAIPGAKREELLIHVDENVLSISVLHQRANAADQANFRLHEFDYNCFDRHIALPEQADPQFVSAEYFSGILHLHLQKTLHPIKSHHFPIVVY